MFNTSLWLGVKFHERIIFVALNSVTKMKFSILSSLSLFFIFTLSAQIPDQIIPNNAIAVVKINGETFGGVVNDQVFQERATKRIVWEIANEIGRKFGLGFGNLLLNCNDEIIDYQKDALFFAALGDSTLELSGVVSLVTADSLNERLQKVLRSDTFLLSENKLITGDYGIAWNDKYLWFTRVVALRPYGDYWNPISFCSESDLEARPVSVIPKNETYDERSLRLKRENSEFNEWRDRIEKERLKRRKACDLIQAERRRQLALDGMPMYQSKLSGFWNRSLEGSIVSQKGFRGLEQQENNVTGFFFTPALSSQVLKSMDYDFQTITNLGSQVFDGMSSKFMVDFLDDEIKLEVQTTSGERNGSYTKRINRTRVSRPLRAYLGEENSVAVMGGGVDLESVLNMYNDIEFKPSDYNPWEMVTTGPTIHMLTRFVDEKELSAMFDGGVVVNVCGVNKKAVSRVTYDYDSEYRYTEVDVKDSSVIPMVVCAIGFSSLETYNDLLKIISDYDVLIKKDEYYELTFGQSFPIYLKLFKDHLAISTDTTLLSGVPGDGGFNKLLKKKTGAAHVDFLGLLDMSLEVSTDLYLTFDLLEMYELAKIVESMEIEVQKTKRNRTTRNVTFKVPGSSNSFGDLFRGLVSYDDKVRKARRDAENIWREEKDAREKALEKDTPVENK